MENKVLQRNLDRIAQYDRKLADKILMFACEKSSISIIKTQKEEYNLVYNSILIHNNNGAADEASLISSKIPSSGNSLRIVYGLGLGYLPDEMAKNLPSDSNIIIYEPKLEILKFVLSIAQIDALYNKNVYLCSDKESFFELVSKLINKETKMTISFLASYKNLFYEDIIEVLKLAQKSQGLLKAQQNTFKFMAFPSLKNQFNNLGSIFKTPLVTKLADIYKGKTALVLSAGPSLKENIEIIKKNKDKFIIFAVNVTLKLLAQYEIEPDFVVAIEPYSSNEHFSKTNTEKTYAILETFTATSVYNQNFKKKFSYISKNNYINPWIRRVLGEKTDIDTYGTVSYTALVSAVLMGFDKIIICGQDLAYKNGECYAKGSQFEELECVFDEEKKEYVIKARDFEKYAESAAFKGFSTEDKVKNAKININFLNSNLCTVKSQDGGLIPTQTGYYLFVDFFSKYAKKIKEEKKDLILINSSTGGAQIDGFENRPLFEVVKELEPVKRISLDDVDLSYDKEKIKQEIDALKTKLNSVSAILEDLKTVLEKLSKEIKIKRTITPNCEKYLKKLRELFSKLPELLKDDDIKGIIFASYLLMTDVISEDFLSTIEKMETSLNRLTAITKNEIDRINSIYLTSLEEI